MPIWWKTYKFNQPYYSFCFFSSVLVVQIIVVHKHCLGALEAGHIPCILLHGLNRHQPNCILALLRVRNIVNAQQSPVFLLIFPIKYQVLWNSVIRNKFFFQILVAFKPMLLMCRLNIDWIIVNILLTILHIFFLFINNWLKT